MSDNYQAVYDAVTNRMPRIDGHALIHTIAEKFDFSYTRQLVQQELLCAIAEYARPSVLYRPELKHFTNVAVTPHQTNYKAVYGDITGYGRTPSEAMTDFDRRWTAL